MKSPSKISGAAIAAALVTASLSYASDEKKVVLVNSNQGQYNVTYVCEEQTPTVALSVNANPSKERPRAVETAVVPHSIHIGEGPTVTYFSPAR